MDKLPRLPDLNAQRAAMKKLEFLIGKWNGQARLLRGPGEWVDLHQSEDAQYKLDGLILVIEGVGRMSARNLPITRVDSMGRRNTSSKSKPGSFKG